MRKKIYEEFDALKVRLGGDDVRVRMSARPYWKQLEFTATGLRKFRAAMNKHLEKVLREKEARETAERDAADERRKMGQLAFLRDQLADEELVAFNFGKLEIADSDGWETETGSNDWNKNVYAENHEGGDSIRLSFHVVFDSKKWSLRVREVYCLDFNTGVMVGKRGKVKA